jgi:hypothetical protein
MISWLPPQSPSRRSCWTHKGCVACQTTALHIKFDERCRGIAWYTTSLHTKFGER